METLILEDFRCFAGRMEVPVRPLTVLVGENSTGKTSFLAAVRAAHDLFFRAAPDFNEEPFPLGSYDHIATHQRDLADSFVIGQDLSKVSPIALQRRKVEQLGSVRVEARFMPSKAQPTMTEISVSSGEYSLSINLEEEKPQISLLVDSDVVLQRETTTLQQSALIFENVQFLFYRGHSESYERSGSSLPDHHKTSFDALVEAVAFLTEPRPQAFAPIRTSPRRTNDPQTEVRDPEGRHIPMMLERLLGSDDERSFSARLEDFGESSGLYSTLGVRKLGDMGSDPFQIEVTLPGGGRVRNLVDVGYGVSQAIPIVADCVSAEPNSTLLIQQPEVHLHPRAQSAMGSFFAELAASRRNTVIVETHSDYLLDRIRIDVRDENISCGDVVILYFEQDRHGVNIHPIDLDAMGNLVNPPDGYRRFFLDEQRRFLGID